LLILTFALHVSGQEEINPNVFARGLFMSKGKYELKLFNNLYTETGAYNNTLNKRSSFLSSFLQLTVGTNQRINYGFDLIYKSSINNDLPSGSPLTVFEFKNKVSSQMINGNEFITDRSHGLSHAGGRIRLKLFKDYRFTVQQALYLPTMKNSGMIVNTDIFFEYLHPSKKVMLFGDAGVWYPINQGPFIYGKLFAGTLIAKRLAIYTMLNLPYEVGGGVKLFIAPKLEMELLYTKWLPIEAFIGQNNPTTFNIGVRYTNFSNF
jgi:hypothetical protein